MDRPTPAQNPLSTSPDVSSGESPELIQRLLEFTPRPKRIGEIMIDLGMIAERDVDEALSAQAHEPRPLGEILVELGRCRPEEVKRALDAQEVLASPLWQALGQFRWKPDLGVTRIEETHRNAVVLSVAERHVQLSPEEFTLAQALVEEDSFPAIAQRFWKEHEQLVWPEQLLTLTTRLWALGMIEMDRSDHADAVPEPQPEPPVAGWARWVQIRIPLHDPSHLLERTLPLGRFLFSRLGLTLVVLLVALASGILSVQGSSLWGLIVGNVTHRWVGGIGSFLIAALCASIIHEYGHALACRHFGGRVRRMGLMLYVLAPMAFCDVSDAHRFASKRHRIIVGAGGIYVQLAVASLCAIAWAWLPLPNAVSLVLAQFVAVTMVSTLANLNPLLKLDGYYILTDWLEIPNLRSRAFDALDAKVKRALGGSQEYSEPRSPRERRAFVWYGILGGAYTVAVAGYMTWMIAHLLLRALALD